jgi:hypothetical protein
VSAPIRRAGHGRSPDGSLVTWSVADGRRGRRWREVVSRDGAVVLSLLLETDPDRRFSHLELSTSAGLLTLHPEGDGTLHGNAVKPDGLDHVRGIPWDAESVVIVEASSLSSAAAVHHHRPDSPVGRPCVRIQLDLSIRPGLVDPDDLRPTSADGLPLLEGAAGWPLEVD